MAKNYIYTIDTGDTGTVTTGVTFTSSGCSVTAVRSKDITIYNGATNQSIRITKPFIYIPTNPVITKEFWDDIKWKEFKTYIPRKSITGKIIIGKMHRRIKVIQKKYMHIQYAKTKELFEEKLRGKA